ncbi:MAG: wax synthase family protein [Polyangiaceae bacterium]
MPPILYVLAALLATGPRWRRALCFAPATVGLLAPYAMPADWRLPRALLALLGIGAILRATDLVFLRQPTTPLRRVTHALSILDSFRVRRVPAAFEGRMAVRIVLFLALAAAGRELAFDVAPALSPRPLSLAVRWFGGLLYVYGFTDVVYAAITFVARALGISFPAIHRDPILSRSVREFWGRRWNRVVSAWLEVRFHRPMARLGHPYVGMALAFLFSALLHAYATHPALGTRWALIVGGYFLLQGGLAFLEGPLGVARWRPAAGHLWVILVMGGLSPLFCEPFLEVVGP